MKAFRESITALELNGISRIAFKGIDNPEVIPLWFGEGDRVTPEFIREAAKRALDEGETFYSYPRGRTVLRDAIKVYLDKLYGIDVNPARISVPGSTMLGITIAAHMGASSGDHALIVSPNWPNIENTFKVTGCDIDYVRQRCIDGRWTLDLGELLAAVTAKTKVIFVNSPCNPTGWVMTADAQLELLTFCRDRNILLIADEVYHRNVFSANVAPSLMSLARDDDPVIVVNGFSKAWAMTGWRIGWMVAPASLANQVSALSECFNTGSTSFAQFGAVAALESGEQFVVEQTEAFRKGRELVMNILGTHHRLELSAPDGAFYAFPRVKGLKSSMEFAEGLLEQEKVGVAPGYTFGPGNDDHFRLCFAQSHERLEDALHRIVRYLGN